MEYKIGNSFINASIKDFGAELCSLKRNGVNLEYIWQADENYWARHSPILFPIVGKLLDNEYIYENRVYTMQQHGFARDNIFEPHEQNKNYICFKFEQNKETFEKYPFNFKLYISYELFDSSIRVSYKLINNSNKTMPFSIGAHPAFNWPLEDEKAEDYYFKFKNKNEIEILTLTKSGICDNKKRIPLNNNKLFLEKPIFKDDALIIKNLENKSILFANNKNDKFVEVRFDGFEYLGLWSKPTGAPFICIEPWHGIADFTNHNKKIEDKKGIKLLKKDETFETFYEIRI